MLYILYNRINITIQYTGIQFLWGKGEKDKVYEKGEKEKFRNGSYKAGESGWLEEVSVLVEGGLSSLLLPRNIS